MAENKELVEAHIGKQKQRRPKKSEQMSVQTQPGDNRKYLEHSMKMWDWPKVDMRDEKAVAQRCFDYFQLCADDDMKPTVEALAFAFGVDRKTLYRWVTGQSRESICPTIKKAYEIITIQMANYMQNGKINPVAGIFLMKNNMGYQDKSEVVLTPNNLLGEQTSPEALEQKYLEAAEIESLDEGE